MYSKSSLLPEQFFILFVLGLGANLNHQDKVNGWTALMQVNKTETDK